MNRRVVVTGMGGITALGERWEDIAEALRAGRSAVRRMPEWDRYPLMNTRLGAPIEGVDLSTRYPRKMTRSMGRVSMLAVRATELALQDAGLQDDPSIKDGRMGIAYGSSSGSVEPVQVFGNMLATGSMQGVSSTSYVQMMPHTAAVNTALYFGLKGRIIPTSSACTSGSQAVGYAFESIRAGRLP
jgi:3-oxoacyl-[acyl-carrier-protein] synthase II